MNWFTTSLAFKLSATQTKADTVTEHGGCEHVEENPELLHAVQFEHDSFGKEGYCVCESCYNSGKEAEGAEPTSCTQCGAVHPKREMHVWQWYDFLASQGDKPLILCPSCHRSDEHRERIRRDNQNLENELGL